MLLPQPMLALIAVPWLALAWATPARATGAVDVSPVSEDPSLVRARASDWLGAVGQLQKDTPEGKSYLGCNRLDVDVYPQGATVRFRVRDGRLATRAIEHPSELVPTVAALSVRAFPPEPPKPVGACEIRIAFLDGKPEAAQPAPQGSTSALPEVLRADSVAVGSPRGPQAWPPPPPPDPAATALARPTSADPAAVGPCFASSSRPLPADSGLLFAAQTGMRYGADRLGTPVIDGFFALAASDSEFGVSASYEPSYRRWQAGAVSQPIGQAAALGVRVGKRHPALGGRFLLGLQAQIAARLQHTTSDAEQRRAEARTGAYVGWAHSKGLPLNLRTTLAFDVLPTRLGHSIRGQDGVPLSPWWALTLGAGVEFGGA